MIDLITPPDDQPWRRRLLGQARADLVALPGLVYDLARTLTERHHDVGGYQAKVIGSPAPGRIPVIHLTDHRRKPGWHGDDPRLVRIIERYGVAPLLESWVRVLAEELPEFPDLTEQATVRSEATTLVEHWTFIESQQWADDLAEDITKITCQVRAALGIRPEYRPRCRHCGHNVIPVDADRKLTSWEGCAYGACTGCDWTYPTGPALVALGQVQKPMPLPAISDAVGVAVITLRRYEDQKLIGPVDKRGNTRLYDLAEVRDAIANMRDRTPIRDSNGTFRQQVAQDA
jgi:hypothetical protein